MGSHSRPYGHYLVHARSGTWCVRIRIPNQYRHLFSQIEYRRSLRAHDRREAVQAARAYVHQFYGNLQDLTMAKAKVGACHAAAISKGPLHLVHLQMPSEFPGTAVHLIGIAESRVWD